MTTDNKRKLYDALSQDYDMGTYEEFCTDLNDEGKRRKLYDSTSEVYDYGTWADFSSQLGYGPDGNVSGLPPEGAGSGGSPTTGNSTVGDAREILDSWAAGRGETVRPYTPQEERRIENAVRTHNELIAPPTVPGVPTVQDLRGTSNQRRGITVEEMMNDFAIGQAKRDVADERQAEQEYDTRTTTRPVVDDRTGEETGMFMSPRGITGWNETEAERLTREMRTELPVPSTTTLSGRLRHAQNELMWLERRLAAAKGRVMTETDSEYSDMPVVGSLYNRFAINKDPEVAMLETAIRQRAEQITVLEDERDRQAGGGVGFWRGFGRVVSDGRTWDFGMHALRDAGTMMNYGEWTGGEGATESERGAGRDMMSAIYDNQEAERTYGGNASFMNRAGVMTGYMPAFMLDFALTGGGFEAINIAGRAAAKGAAKLIGEEAIKEITKLGVKQYVKQNGLRGAGRIAGNWTIKALGTTADELLIRAPLMTNTVQGADVAADIVGRKLGDVVLDENGNYNFENDATWGSSIWQGEANAIIENYSEMFGTHLDGAIPAVAGVFGGKRISGMLARLSGSGYGKVLETTRRQFERLGMSDYLGEVGEEYYGQLWRTALNLDDAYQTNSDGSRTNLLLTGQFHGDIWGGMALSMGLIGGAKYTLAGISYAGMKHRVNCADRAAAEIFTPERWEPIRELIDNTTNEDMGAMAESVIKDSNLSEEERNAVMSYMEYSMYLRGNNLGAMAQSRGVDSDPVKEGLNASYFDGYTAGTPEEMRDVEVAYEKQRERASGELGDVMCARLEADPVNELAMMSSSGDYTGEQIAVALDFANAAIVRDGMIRRVNDDIEEQIARSDAMIDSRTNRTTGLMQTATMGLEGKEVYVVSGNPAVNSDGSIDREGSDESIIVRDAATGELAFTTPRDITVAGQATDAATAKAEAAERIRQELAQAAVDKINGAQQSGMEAEAMRPQFALNDEFSIVDEAGNHIRGSITGELDEDGKIEVKTEKPINGYRVNRYTPEELERMIDTYNGEALRVSENAETVPNIEENTDIAGQTGDNMTGTVPKTDDTEPQQSALSQIPLDEDGQPRYNAAEPSLAWDAIVEQASGDEEIAMDVVSDYVAEAEAELKAAEKALAKTKDGKPEKRKGGDAAPTMEERIMAKRAAKAALGEAQAARDRAEAELEQWRKIAGTRQRRESERQRAEQAAEHDAAIARYESEQRQRAEQAAEQSRVGSNAAGAQVREKWESSPKILGNANELVMADGSTISGHYVMTEAGAASASHDPENGYVRTIGFPVDENGQSVNDRDYQRDRDAQRMVERMAGSYDSRALQTPVIVSSDGVVLSGNNRTMSGDIAARQGTDAAYVEYLNQYGGMYGFTSEQVSGMSHPRVVFVPDEALPYTAGTFARFNAQEMKSQSKPEAAVKLGKIVPDDVFGVIVSDINRYERMSDYYSNEGAAARALGALHGAGVINDAQMPELRTGTALSAAGKELLENTLIGKVFQSDPDAVRKIMEVASMRQTIVMALAEIANNRALAVDGYDLIVELSQAVDLCYRAKTTQPDVYRVGVPVSPFGRMQGLFDDEYGESSVTDAMTLLLSDMLNDTKPSRLRNVLTSYNKEAGAAAAGSMDLFTGSVATKETILTEIKEYFNNATPEELQSRVDAAIAERRAAAESANRIEAGREAADAAAGGERDELDENGIPFVISPNGTTVFGEIREDSGLPEAPIKLSKGYQDNEGKGYGLLHIEANHGNQIRKAGFESVEDFVSYVSTNYDEDNIRVGKKRKGRTATYLIQVSDEHDNTLFIELSRDGSYWSVNSGGIFRKDYSNKKETVAKTEPQQPNNAISDDSSLSEKENIGTISSEPNGKPTVSVGKDSNSASDKQGVGAESSLSERVKSAEAEVDVNPTDGQKEAGNYKKGHVQVGAFDVTIEQPVGSVRRGTDANGKPWETEMHNTYGYIRGTEGVDGDHIDVFLSTDIDGWTGRRVVVVDQYNPDGTFDEHKVMLGFNDMEEAKAAYLSNYEQGWETGRRLVFSSATIEDFEKWIDSSHRKTKAFHEYVIAQNAEVEESDAGNGKEQRQIGNEGDAKREVYDVAKGLVESAGIEVVEVSDAEAAEMLVREADDVKLMGSRTDQKMRAVWEHYAGGELDGNEQAVVDVFSGKADNRPIEVERPEGKVRVVIRQGNEQKAGAKHSLYRHFETWGDYFTADEIVLIPLVISKGQRKEKGKRISYEYTIENGIRLKVTTEKGNIEKFTNFYTNRKPLQSKTGVTMTTQLSARASTAEVSDAKVSNSSDMANGEMQSGSKVKLLRSAGGTVYGWTVGGKVYLNRDAMESETPVHEYTHLWDEMVRRDNPELWARGVELMKQTPLWDEVRNAPEYADIRDDEDAVASEVHARLTGKSGASILGAMIEKSRADGAPGVARTVTLVERIKEWLRDMFRELKATLGKWSGKELAELTADDFAHLTLRDLAEGLNPHESKRDVKNTGATGVRKNAAMSHNREDFDTMRERAVSEGGIKEEVAESPTQGTEGDTKPEVTVKSDDAEGDEYIMYRAVTDKAVLDRLNTEPTIKVYRAMQLIDGGLRPPMSAKVEGQLREATEIGKWEEAEEHPELADEDGRFKLDKGNGKSIKAAYNPYFHTSKTPINDQFSSAWSRPELVIVEAEVPESELTSGYHADKAKDSVGEKAWKSGPVGRALAKVGQARKVILSRWSKVVRIVPVEEVAEAYAQRLNAHGIEVPFNTVPPALREALVDKGVKVGKPENGNAGAASLWAFEQWLSEQERARKGDGYGAYSDGEVSYANDPISKALGENRFSKKRQAEYAARERRRMVKRIEELAELMHLDNVEILTDTSQLRGHRATAKGFYNKRTQRITVVIPNHVSTIDAEQTLLHEAVAHYGLRKLFGSRFDTFLANVFESVDKSIHDKIVELGAKNGWEFREATEEYLATLAEDTNFNETRSYTGWWSRVKQLFLDMLEEIGFKGFRDATGVVLTDNELRYLLWRSYKNLTEPGMYRGLMSEAEDVAQQSRLGVGNYAVGGIEAEYAAEPGNIDEINERFNNELQQQINGTLEEGHIYQLGKPGQILRSTGVPSLPIQLNASRLNYKATAAHHDFDLSELKSMVHSLQNPLAVFRYGERSKAQNIILEITHNGKNFVVGLSLRPTVKGQVLEINSIRTVYPKDNHEWLKWITDGKLLYVDKEKIQPILTQQRMTFADVEKIGLDLNDAAKIVKNFENPTIEEEELYRPGDFTPRDKVVAREYYERMCAKGTWQFREAMQDSMLGLKTLYESVLGKQTRIEEVAGFENAYLYENRMSSTNAGEQHEYFSEYMKPLMEEISKIAGSNKRKRQELTDYMMAKHGLERNAYMRNEAAANEETTDRDFAGLTGLTGERDWQQAEAVARKWVEDYEALYDTTGLWSAVNAATKASLEKLYMSGVLSKESYEKIRDMYSHYVPLRGWDETTSDEVYGYLTSKEGPLSGSIIKKARGRESIADDPIATIAMMADDAIRQGNRNIMKQRFLNFVMNHPSDAVSVNELWLEYDKVTKEWRPVFADVKATDTAEEVEQKVAAFEQRMASLKESEPEKYKRGREAQQIPYKVVRGHIGEHQVLVKRNGRTYVLTINGNPRAAQALNGLTNPDVETGGVVGNMLKAGTWVNRQLSALYTTRNPDFVVSNFFRDMLYSNCMTWVKESPRYALRYHKNFGRYNPVMLRKLLGKWESGSLDMNNEHEKLFYEFMKNGGETGYTNVRDIESHKKAVSAELRKAGSVGRKTWKVLGMQLDLLNRSAENCARFAAFVTSRELGRSIDRSIYDAKEVSVNFNKKGSGGKMVNANGQSLGGRAGSYLSGGGRIAYVFWNAGIQGMTNFSRQAKNHPAKFICGASALFSLGYLIPILAEMLGGGDGDDDDKNAYYNLPEYIRRSNICFKAGGQWITIPLPIEYRAMYGLGELAYGMMSGNEHYTNSELGYAIASQVSQILPLDFLEGGGGVTPFIPSAVKPIAEAYILNRSWSGLPIYKDTPYNKNMPEWTKAYASADRHIVDFAKWLNETSGGDDYRKGAIDINPSKIEYLLNGYLGGMFTFPSKFVKSAEAASGRREFDWRNIPIGNRLVKSGDERTANRKLRSDYYKYKEEYEQTGELRRKYKNAAQRGLLEYVEKLNFIENSPEYGRWLIFDMYRPAIDIYQEMLSNETDQEIRRQIETEQYSLMREMVDELRKAGNKSRPEKE